MNNLPRPHGHKYRVVVGLDQDQYEALSRLAAARRVGRGTLVRSAVDLFLAVNSNRGDITLTTIGTREHGDGH